MPPLNLISEPRPGLPTSLEGLRGKQYWRSLQELADPEGFAKALEQEREHEHEHSELEALRDNPVSRRQFLSLMGASLALAGLAGCTKPPTVKIMPYVRQPEELIPGRPLFYATAFPLSGRAIGLLVETHEGRPTKIEGNPDHPASLGATDAFAQASILTMYDPDRSRKVTHFGQITSWQAVIKAIAMDMQRPRDGAGLRILTEKISSPTLLSQLSQLLKKFPKARWHEFEPAGSQTVSDGVRTIFGEEVSVYHDFRKADVVLSIDADFLSCGPGHLRYVRDFTDWRRVRRQDLRMNRLYAVESTPTNTGAVADHRLPLRPTEIEAFTRSLAAQLGVISGPQGNGRFGTWNLNALAEDLKRHRGTSLVLAGNEQPRSVQLLAHAMNQTLGNIGKTVIITDPVETDLIERKVLNRPNSLEELLQDMRSGLVEVLLILGGNPAFTAPVDYDFAAALLDLSRRKDVFTAHLSLYEDETSRLCQWHLPETHYLETWSDARAYDGTATIMQPMIAPLYDGRSAHEALALFANAVEQPGHDIVKSYWRRFWENQVRSGDFETFWQRSLHNGVVADTKLPNRDKVTFQKDWAKNLGTAPAAQGYEIVFRTDPAIYDGRFANNGWLQEWPKPLTRLTWDNAVLMSPATAALLGLRQQKGNEGGPVGWHSGEHGEVIAPLVRIRYQGREIVGPAWMLPGHPDGSFTIHLGYGRTRAGKVGTGVGFNAYSLRTAQAPWQGTGVTVEATGEHQVLAGTQQHFLMENRRLVRSATLEEYRADPDFAKEKADAKKPLTLYPGFDYSPPKHRWGMSIDLTTCTGCGACVVACQAENNIPVVGKDQVIRGREMHWLRIDRYYEGPVENPHTFFEPVPCQQCETAPCELVCPVHATVHSDDGLNDMVYNRCVGTRYCSNNCPYKVRRFNFLQYADYTTESLKLLYNPDVTVRSRGVMEKCTYCVQRIREAEIDAEKRKVNGEPVAHFDIQTACQQACPARAIIFGDINDEQSEVHKLKEETRDYGLFAELGTLPRTTYLAALKNPNPDLER
ncbi:MAG TPA: TAT-variant-translocated molybdopterin oxidoreductase [Gemmataceae bacterium]|jgi:molybdopterin-containing oxidoreductase family iron-sulfur binding subunit|nr:TAT-variant-translocated molybdopterin oxidoreductase [Gemmataceae bacterium]